MEKSLKEVLLKDLCARLPYKVIVEIVSYADETSRPWFGELSCKDLDCFIHDVAYESIKPYLLPMSSMTEEELDIYRTLKWTKLEHEVVDWLNAHHFDYRGLIPMGLAIEVTKENNPYEEIVDSLEYYGDMYRRKIGR